MAHYRDPASPRGLLRIEWLDDEVSYGRVERRAWRVLDRDGTVILDLHRPPLDLAVSSWVIVKGDVDERGEVTVRVRCESGRRSGLELELEGRAGSADWRAGDERLEGPALAAALTRLAGDRAG